MEENKNELFEKIFQLKSLIDKFTEEGIIKEKINFPNICAIGDINSGKTSTLESLLKINILPIGRRERTTLCPFEINLNHIDTEETYAILEDIKYEDFSKLKEILEQKLYEIEEFKKLEKTPIILNIYSKKYPGLKLIDLPGFSHIPLGEAPKNIDEYPIHIAEKYINNPLNILLSVIPATRGCSLDYYALSGIRIPNEMSLMSEEPNNLRKLGVLTKIDIMDLQTDARDMLLNKVMPIELGYIGVKNKSNNDIKNNLSYDEIIKNEKEFFNSHEKYKDLPKDILGNDALMKKISKIYFKIVKDNLPNNVKNEEKIKKLLDLLDQYSLKDEEIFDLKKIKKEKEKEDLTKNKKVKKYGNLFG